jgi:hypothetical protein
VLAELKSKRKPKGIEMDAPTLTDLNPEGIEVTVRIVATGNAITQREVVATCGVLSPVGLRRDLIAYMETLAKGGEVDSIE